MTKESPIYTNYGWITHRMVEAVNSQPGCSAEVIPNGDPPACQLVLAYEDEAARDRMYDAIGRLVPEFQDFLGLLERARAEGSQN